MKFRNSQNWEFLGSPAVRTQSFHCQGAGSIPGRRIKITQAVRRGQKKNKPQNSKQTKPNRTKIVKTNDDRHQNSGYLWECGTD